MEKPRAEPTDLSVVDGSETVDIHRCDRGGEMTLCFRREEVLIVVVAALVIEEECVRRI